MFRRIGIVGAGFVGNAVAEGLALLSKRLLDSGEDAPEHMVLHDPPKGIDNWDEITKCDLVYVCVWTPMRPDGTQDASAVEEVLAELSKQDSVAVVLLKSTVLPDKARELWQDYPRLTLVANPEFLRERCALEDFLRPRFILLGEAPVDVLVVEGYIAGIGDVRRFYHALFPGVPVEVTGFEAAMMVKYAMNCLLPVRLSLLGELKLLWDKLGYGPWEEVVRAIMLDARPGSGSSHMRVPGPDGQMGFGGSCFIKDPNAMLALMRRMGVPCHTLQGALDTNLEVRKDRDWEKMRRAVTDGGEQA